MPRTFSEVDKTSLTAIEVTVVSPSFDDGDLILRHERSEFDEPTWTDLLACTQTPAGTSTLLGYSYISGCRQGGEYWEALVAPHHLTNPATDAAGQPLQVDDVVHVAVVDNHHQPRLVQGRVELLDTDGPGVPVIRVATTTGSTLFPRPEQIVKR